MTPVTPGKGRALKRRWPTDDNPTDSEEEQRRQTRPVCKQCSNANCRNDPSHLAQHSLAHLSFRPWKCSVCTFTAKLKGNVQKHLNEQHQGNGRVIDNRTAEYYDALEAKTKANFPAHSVSIAKYIGGQKEALGFQDASDDEDDKAQDGGKISVCMGCKNSIDSTEAWRLALHSSTHLAIRPWKCSACACTMTQKGNLQLHLNVQHQGNGRIIDNRTAEYYDALKAKTQANFPDRAKAIAKYIGGQKYGLGIQRVSDDEDSTPEDDPPIVHLPTPGDKSLDVRRNEQKSTEAASSNAGTGRPSNRTSKVTSTTKLGGAKISSDMARMRAAMRETKADVVRMQIHMALLESLSETRNAENRRLKQQNDQQAAMMKMLLEERTAMKERMRNG